MVELGASVIDTTAAYGDSEALIGDAVMILGIRDRLFIARSSPTAVADTPVRSMANKAANARSSV